MADYSKTVLLPKTQFAMKANLSQREPSFLKFWDEIGVYSALLAKNSNSPLFVLHDGPPYANGHIHVGTALNKILKDVVVKYKALRGFRTPFVPGWDCHGMPIEHQVIREERADKHTVDRLSFRKKAAAYARRFVEIQKKEFIRLGVIGEWNSPYLTLSPEYEAEIVRAFGDLALAGYVYQAEKPIHWCLHCETALAEAEIEYQDDTSPSIVVRFPVKKEHEEKFGGPASFLIWTTTPWTLPANTGIALHPQVEYALCEKDGKRYILASALAGKVVPGCRVSATFAGADLAGVVCVNLLTGRDSRVVLAEYVSIEEGTGCVHTAPGHGEEDYLTGKKEGLPILSPVDEKGRFTKEVPEFAGRQVFEANPAIVRRLAELGVLVSEGTITHAYPHCWRCRKPVIYRSTKQWFLNVEHRGLRGLLGRAITETRWVPPEGARRIGAMVAVRPDWCLSRQRLWGVPLPIFFCASCRRAVLTGETIDRLTALVGRHGSDIWFEKDAAELLPEGFVCPSCGGKEFEKEQDILDVWFDSGVSHLAALKEDRGLRWPADLYLEGSDQHRGWFQTSLITSCGIKGRAPYGTVVTHGWVTDAEGRKMSKSLGNVITPEEVIKHHGADILRFWAVSSDYQQDVRISDEILRNVVTRYRTIRNTLRFLLGNLSDFRRQDAVPETDLPEVDRWALEKLQETVNEVTAHYENFSFYRACDTLFDFCNIWMSAFYLDILKDRLYTYPQRSIERRSAQTTLDRILRALVVLLAPALTFTAEDAYQCLPEKGRPSVLLEDWPGVRQCDEALLQRWERFFEFRRQAMKAIEEQRTAKAVGSSLEADLVISCNDDWYGFLSSFSGIEKLLMVAAARLKKGGEGLSVTAGRTSFPKCPRCWIHTSEVGSDRRFPDICGKCAAAVAEPNRESSS